MTVQLSEAVRLLIARLLEAQDMKGSRLAEVAGLPQTSVSRKLRGEGRFDLDDLTAIAPVFGLSAHDLVAWAEKSLPPNG